MIIPLVIILYGVSLITFFTNVNNGLMLAIYIAIYILMVSIQDYKPVRRSFKERLKKSITIHNKSSYMDSDTNAF